MNKTVGKIVDIVKGKNTVYLLICLVIILALLFYGENENVSDTGTSLEQIISQIDGVGKAEVMITYEETVSAGTFLEEEKSAAVKGVVVVAKGAQDYMVKIQIQDAVCTALDIEHNRVEVFS